MEIAQKWISLGHPAKLVLRFSGIPRSSYYYYINYRRERKNFGGRPIPGYSLDHYGNRISDEEIKKQIRYSIENDGYNYGYIKLTIWLRRKLKLKISKKKVYRLLKEMGLLRPQRLRKGYKPRRLAKKRNVTGINQLWEIDIKYGYIAGEDRFFFVAAVLDVFDRTAIDYHCGLSCTGADIAAVLTGALEKRSPEVMPTVRTDNGPQFISHAFEMYCHNNGIEHERIPTETPNAIAHIEAFHSILEDDCLCYYEFESFQEAYRGVMEFMSYYNRERIHSAIGYRSPYEYYKEILSDSEKALSMIA